MKRKRTKEEGRSHYLKNRERYLENARAWRLANPSRYREIGRSGALRRKYGLSLEEYESLLREQRGGCAICGAIPAELGRSLAVDHCHETGKVRGLLCDKCNTALGLFSHCIESLNFALEYLRRL